MVQASACRSTAPGNNSKTFERGELGGSAWPTRLGLYWIYTGIMEYKMEVT